ncbi:MAG: ABC transporter permease [Thermodesulfobacteriota bacterium]|nr:ABC transporter permease [Thermodesulfobacteriota bacterium]
MTKPDKDNATSPFIHIRARKGWELIDFSELKEYRDLFYFLVLRDIKVRYKQTVLGGLWAIIRPFFSMVVFTLFFGKLAKMPSDGVPYPVFNYTAMVAWTYFAGAVSGAGNSVIGNANLISKVYFPRLIIPSSRVLAGLLDFSIAFFVLIGMMLYFHIYPTPMMLFVPVLVFLMIFSATGVGTFLAALNTKYRDIRYTIPFLVQLWMFSSPIVYPVSLVPEKYRLLYALNPMAGVIEGFRSVLLGTVSFPTHMLLISAIVSITLFTLGLFYFKRVERYFADII